MLEEPALDRAAVVTCVRDGYDVDVADLTFLPLGADSGTAVYRLAARDGAAYLLKLRRAFDAAAVEIPHFLRAQGIEPVMAPLVTSAGELSLAVDGFQATLFPYVDGHDAADVPLSDRRWFAFGDALKAIHATVLPAALQETVRHETYSTEFRDAVVRWLRVADDVGGDPVSTRFVASLRARRAQIEDVVRRAAGLAVELSARPPEPVLCHSDVHAANLLLDDHSDRLYIVDWDDPVMAPKERDLMFVGGGVCGVWDTPREERLFYAGYGTVDIDPIALAYYRFDRIVADIAAFCEEVLVTAAGDDREQSAGYFESQFHPGGVLDIAYSSLGPTLAP